jgi:hypothetical protein
MLNLTLQGGALSLTLLTCSAAQAQTSLRPDPLNGLAPVPALTLASPFAAYRRAAEQSKPLSWREANDAAARIGGWRVYAREAQAPEAPPALTVPDKPPPAHDHKMP